MQEEAVSIATTDLGSVMGGDEGGAGPAGEDPVFLRPRTPPRREDRQPLSSRSAVEATADHSEESDADSASATTTSSYDDLSKDMEDKVRNN